ncbi:hypothetical protein Ddye_024703 [Dipteronia dyeriana]|uniref:TIR domain-containing protein n=1 Tax=Dipteronia dyeriana TaxID=168575 RepID=A0AAD9TWC9_9ROSI|nr:hypothetical protein Ddye_024703 [Dipteronia dyeriana]
MGASESACSSTTNSGRKYDVFISFRGEDIRHKFKSHLCDALSRQQIEFFVDDFLARGDEIWPTLSRTIENSNISMVVFSKHYATSKWCLRELVKILECKKTDGQIVIPVFYHVSPSVVRKKTGSFGDAILNHENVFQEEKQMWRSALTEASYLSGWNASVIRYESELVNEIVKDVLKKLIEISTTSDSEGLVGINSRIEKVKSLLYSDTLDPRVVGIWGMGGLGKTTIAGAVFDQISRKFEGCCFVANVRESEKCGRLVYTRDKAVSQILGQNVNVGTPNIPSYIKHRLQKKKVLIVLDEVNNLKQLEILTGGIDKLGQGSRVIITTRDRQLLCTYGVEFIYEVELFKYHQALQLFCKYAFKQDYPPEDFMMFTDKVVNYANGNPLVLKVVGSSLYRKSKKDWKSALHKLDKISNPEINNLLRINNEEKDIFLDVACFFKGETRDFVMDILNGCYFSAQFGLSALIDKSLVTASFNNRIEMHDLLQKMGWEIVREESFNMPGERSRLHDQNDTQIYSLYFDYKGTEAFKGIFLNMSIIKDMHLSSRAFKKMYNVRFLKFYQWNQYSRVHLSRGLKYLPDELRYLHWVGYPSRVVPSNLSLENLHASKLKRLILSNSKRLTRIPDLSDSPCLEVVNLKYCVRLLDISLSIQGLKNLRYLYLEGCKSPRGFARNVHFESLVTLDLSFCTNLMKFPQISGNIKELYLRWTGIKEVPSAIENLTGVFVLDLSDCERLIYISANICKPESLEDINLSGTAVREVSMSSLTGLKKLKRLQLSECRSLTIPSLSGSLCSLRELLLNNCHLVEIPEDIGCLSSLERLELGGNDFRSLPKSMKQLPKLRKLHVNDCNMLRSLMELPSSLEYLEAINCKKLRTSPDASEFAQVVAERCMNGVPYLNCIFINSPKLNQKALSNILAESLQIIQHRATAEKHKKGIDLGMCYPGSEMPDWFHNQMEIPLHNWYNRKFLGLALRAVIAFKEYVSNDNYYMTVPYKCLIKTNHATPFGLEGFLILRGHREYKERRFINSDHVVLRYHDCSQSELLKDGFTDCTVVFGTPDFGQKYQVKHCGVYPIFAEPYVTRPCIALDKPSAINQDVREAMNEEYHITRRLGNKASTSGTKNDLIVISSDEEEMEPHPKRIRTKLNRCA